MHLEKYKPTQVSGLIRHDLRRSENHSNENIDKTRSHLNYDLSGHDNPYEYYKERISQIKVQKRDDVKTMCSWCATLPKTMDIKEADKFFRGVYNFMCKRYGKENIVSAVVHMDETTPHIHIKFIPAVRDKKHPERYKCSAKEVINRRELQTIHKDLSKEMEKLFGRDIGILNGATAGGNRDILELKNKTLEEQIEAKQLELFDTERQIKRNGKIMDIDEIKQMDHKPSLFNKDKVVIDKSEINNLSQTMAYYGSVEDVDNKQNKRARELDDREIALNNRETEFDRKIHIRDERFKKDLSDLKDYAENYEPDERTIQREVKDTDEKSYKYIFTEFLKNKSRQLNIDLIKQFNAFIHDVSKDVLKSNVKKASKEIIQRYDDFER